MSSLALELLAFQEKCYYIGFCLVDEYELLGVSLAI